MARLFADENFPWPAVEVLRSLGHDVVTVEDVGRGGQRWADPDVLEFARSENRILMTMNRKDFLRLHRNDPRHAGLIVCTVDIHFEGLAKRIHHALGEQSDFAGKVFRIHRPPR